MKSNMLPYNLSSGIYREHVPLLKENMNTCSLVHIMVTWIAVNTKVIWDGYNLHENI